MSSPYQRKKKGPTLKIKGPGELNVPNNISMVPVMKSGTIKVIN